MAINDADHGTALNLELLRSTKPGDKHGLSLYSVLNHTNTRTGALTLRANILEPPTGMSLLAMRLIKLWFIRLYMYCNSFWQTTILSCSTLIRWRC